MSIELNAVFFVRWWDNSFRDGFPEIQDMILVQQVITNSICKQRVCMGCKSVQVLAGNFFNLLKEPVYIITDVEESATINKFHPQGTDDVDGGNADSQLANMGSN